MNRLYPLCNSTVPPPSRCLDRQNAQQVSGKRLQGMSPQRSSSVSYMALYLRTATLL